jgi:hypothetical protein
MGASPLFFIRNWTIARFSIVSIRNRTQDFINCTHFRNSQIFTHWAYFTQISYESQIFTQMVIFSHIQHISHKYPMKVKFSHKWSYFHTLSIFYTIILLLSIAILVSLKFWTFSWWSLRKYGASLANGILGLIIEVMKGGISSNWSISSSSMAFSTPTIYHFLGITMLSLLFVVSGT